MVPTRDVIPTEEIHVSKQVGRWGRLFGLVRDDGIARLSGFAIWWAATLMVWAASSWA